jgi:hypothetical protein
MVKFQAIIRHRSFVEIKMLGILVLWDKPPLLVKWPVMLVFSVIPKVPWTSLDIWSSKGRTFTGPTHFLLEQKKLTQFKCNILFFCIFIYVRN